MNDNGINFPLWSICLGTHVLNLNSSNRTNVFSEVENYDNNDKIFFNQKIIAKTRLKTLFNR